MSTHLDLTLDRNDTGQVTLSSLIAVLRLVALHHGDALVRLSAAERFGRVERIDIDDRPDRPTLVIIVGVQ